MRTRLPQEPYPVPTRGLKRYQTVLLRRVRTGSAITPYLLKKWADEKKKRNDPDIENLIVVHINQRFGHPLADMNKQGGLTLAKLELCSQENVPYNRGAFRIEINFPAEYPFKPPKITFRTKIYHPNIDEKGQVCLPIISPDNWKPATKTDQAPADLRAKGVYASGVIAGRTSSRRDSTSCPESNPGLPDHTAVHSEGRPHSPSRDLAVPPKSRRRPEECERACAVNHFSVLVIVTKGDYTLRATRLARRRAAGTEVIQALIALVNDPEPEHPLRADLAEEYSKDRKKFLKNAEDFTKKHSEKRPQPD
ncbi:hypothetical protein HPB47_006942 [Ixodes persulcatus]|uniref:Uncharacterized protein n=1 Tax=Ixodes persulcatus TaxID=34615 RepID=A0AC60P8P2_IXOPE|nr:hypothetical protein HPB47_006942 [Ixodes persulcatus]